MKTSELHGLWTCSFDRTNYLTMKEVLLDTAIEHFGQLGFEAAATRAIAKDANAAMSSITYHFGGKEGLYLACADHIAHSIDERISPLLDQLAADSLPSPAAACERVCVLLAGFAGMMLDPASANWSKFVVREQQTPTEAFERLYEGAMKRIVETVVGLIAQARPDLPDADVRASAILLWGQAIMLRIGRASACRIMQVEELDPETARILVDRLLANARCILLLDPETV